MAAKHLEEPQGGLPRNYLRASLLLLIGETPAHGYDLLDQIAGLGLHSVDPGGLYRALRVMESEGLVASEWEHSSAGPARRTYRLTSDGVDWLHAWAGALRESHRYLSAYLERYDGMASAPMGPAAADADAGDGDLDAVAEGVRL
ncbi:MAG: PadR family transcriptional regulator [Actinobacteria bacterium]|nr:PadR family transcriptional regulator [Actinomycetota bacterium]MBW3650868.1 PadR family transcriptional regulator [Actinomycetota bacterium]